MADRPKRAAPPPTTEKVDYGVVDRLLPIDAIKEIVGLGKTMIYRLERQGKFPQRFKPGGAASRWSEREVMDWRENQRGRCAS